MNNKLLNTSHRHFKAQFHRDMVVLGPAVHLALCLCSPTAAAIAQNPLKEPGSPQGPSTSPKSLDLHKVLLLFKDGPSLMYEASLATGLSKKTSQALDWESLMGLLPSNKC